MISLSLSLSLSLYIHIYNNMYIYIYVYVCICISICIMAIYFWCEYMEGILWCEYTDYVRWCEHTEYVIGAWVGGYGSQPESSRSCRRGSRRTGRGRDSPIHHLQSRCYPIQSLGLVVLVLRGRCCPRRFGSFFAIV